MKMSERRSLEAAQGPTTKTHLLSPKRNGSSTPLEVQSTELGKQKQSHMRKVKDQNGSSKVITICEINGKCTDVLEGQHSFTDVGNHL